MKILFAIGGAIALGVIVAGCSAYLSATKPGRRDLAVLGIGTPRRVLIGELGLPIESSHADDGMRVDLWNFAQGDSNWVKVPKTMFHVGADVFTLGMWEVVGTPVEILLKSEPRTYVVMYDEGSRVRAVTILGKGGFVEQRGTTGPLMGASRAAVVTGSPTAPELYRQAALDEIATKHSMRVTALVFNPKNGAGIVAIDGSGVDDEPRIRDYIHDLCTSDGGLWMGPKGDERGPDYIVKELVFDAERCKVSFECEE